MNRMFAYLYSSGFWILQSRAFQVAKCMFYFGGAYQRLAYLMLRAGKNRYQMIPKLHYFMHVAHKVQQQASMARWVQSPLATTVQTQEDYVGRPSRISRRVAIRKVHTNVVHRSLIMASQALKKAGKDQ